MSWRTKSKSGWEAAGKPTLESRARERALSLLATHEVPPLPDDVLGEAVKAFVVPRSSSAEGVVERVEAFCKLRMPAHLVPREIVVVGHLPKNESGKVLKRWLK